MADSKVFGIIPARYHSTRFPGKLLARVPTSGKSVLQMTLENTLSCKSLHEVFVATDDERIASHVQTLGGTPIMTSSDCPNGTARIIEALKRAPKLKKASVIVNIQGDHPCISSQTIEATVEALKSDKKAVVATAVTPITDIKAALSPHIVKCVFDKNHNALYFSRSLIPYTSKKTSTFYHHLGLYAYRPDFLLTMQTLPDTHLQNVEDLEQLKVLEHGYRIKVAIVKEKNPFGIDTPEDLTKLKEFLKL